MNHSLKMHNLLCESVAPARHPEREKGIRCPLACLKYWLAAGIESDIKRNKQLSRSHE